MRNLRILLSDDHVLVRHGARGLHDGRVKVPVLADFYFFEDVDAIFAAVAVPAFRHRGVAFRR